MLLNVYNDKDMVVFRDKDYVVCNNVCKKKGNVAYNAVCKD